MYMHYPSKQTIFIFLFCLAAIASMFFYVSLRSPRQIVSLVPQPSVFNKAQEMFASTSVSTSTEWRKAFLETGSSSNSFKTPAKVANKNATTSLSATDKFGRGMISQYLTLKQVGLMKDSEIVSSTVASLLAQSDADSGKPREYNISNVKIDPDTSTSTLKEYGNIIGRILLINSPAKDDAALALAGMKKTNPTYKEEIGANIEKYKIVLIQFLAMKVPRSMASYHLNLVNGASDMIFIASALQVSETDPMRAMSGLKMYSTAFQSILQNVGMIRNKLGSAGITYTDSEGGSFFNLKSI